jgi:hypothetical protein
MMIAGYRGQGEL